ncbi:hypothetical protein LQE92_08970 [Lacrimispora sp. NSJ-141]|uniref:Uncharacterized protein n=1 Tax=Lientehia hominis TaxID=2897778 RepID=A0AAP2WA79_9FIRM|nr:hypothetical protein [Lientehia hominis]MCD2492759.1 hypothetical protein [Lientehia hominis]
MISNDVSKLEKENSILKEVLAELSKKMEQNRIVKPKSCQYCKHYLQYYIKGGMAYRDEYTPIYNGHCTKGVPIKKGGKRNPKPDDTCVYFEIGTYGTKYY